MFSQTVINMMKLDVEKLFSVSQHECCCFGGAVKKGFLLRSLPKEKKKKKRIGKKKKEKKNLSVGLIKIIAFPYSAARHK